MRIVVLGGGTVGTSISEMLCQSRHSVTVVDDNAGSVRDLNETLDVRAVLGSASQSSVLFQAGVAGADLCLAMTGNDEVNLVAGSMAKAMGARRTIARVYAPVFRDLSTFDYQRHFNIDRLLSLEHLTAMEFARGIRHPGSVAVENLARGELGVQEIDVSKKSSALDQPLKSLGLPKAVRVGSIQREGQFWIAGAEDRLQAGDRITLIGRHAEVDQVCSMFRHGKMPKQEIVIAGGGESGFHLARALEGLRYKVVLMEADRDRCEHLAARLKSTTVVHSDATRRINLEEERVGRADVFVACMGDDEASIMAGVEARELGTQTIMAIVRRPDYANVVAKLGIDLAVSPREVVAKQVLGYLNEGPLISRMHLGAGNISVIEIEVLSDTLATEHVLAKLELPSQCLIAAVLRGEFAMVPGADDRLQAGDTVVVLVADEVIDDVIKLFGGGH
ncbi:MAG: Trk system potassium transporter TrkA [Planctomycetales bacterium]|nr:Trk system potassium transporter TrkA [Planctomycetales bacterium]